MSPNFCLKESNFLSLLPKRCCTGREDLFCSQTLDTSVVFESYMDLCQVIFSNLSIICCYLSCWVPSLISKPPAWYSDLGMFNVPT